MLPIQANKQTMSSREIAELTGKEHSKVVADIKRVLDEAEIGDAVFRASYLTPQNKELPCYNLPRRECDLVIAGYSVKYRLAIIDRWQELEAQQSLKIPQTLSGALMLAAQQAEQIERHQLLIEQQKPAVEFVEKYVNATGLMGFRQTAKLLKVKENWFRKFLQDKKIMYPLGGEWRAYGHHIEAGRFEPRAGVSETNGHAFNADKLTRKGFAWIAGLVAAESLGGNEGMAS